MRSATCSIRARREAIELAAPLLAIRNLTVQFRVDSGWVTAIDDVSLDVDAGECVGVVGESGSGKSVTALSILGLHARATTRISSGTIEYQGQDLLRARTSAMRRIRGSEIAMIFQDPMSSLNPVLTIADQISETLRQHQGLTGEAARKRVVELLGLVRIPDAARRADDYPHRLSGGMRQRVMIAMAIACKPRLLIADEPTTALDVTIQAQILELLRDLRKELSMSVMLISHDLGVIAEFAQRVVVMYAGRVVEDAPVAQLFRRPVHPYTMGLISAVPKLDGDAPRLNTIPGRIPSPQEVIPGCRFSPRCTLVQDGCLDAQPAMQPAGDRQSARCPPRLLALGGRHG
jgi:peptide/nickel transport system ATP-binding protein